MTRWPCAAALRGLLQDNGLPVIGEAADGLQAVAMACGRLIGSATTGDQTGDHRTVASPGGLPPAAALSLQVAARFG
jgi:hypothetical protein